MKIPKVLKDYIKAALAGGFLLSVVASMIAGGFFRDPAWRRDPSSPIRTYPIYGGITGIVAGLLVEFRNRKNSRFKKTPNRKDLKELVEKPPPALWDESHVPIDERVLKIAGKADVGVAAGLFKDFAASMGPNRVCCFVFFTYADLPIGKEFEIVFRGPEPRSREEVFRNGDIVGPLLSTWSRFNGPIECTATRAVVVAVTQQFGIETEVMPRGWKTITILEFPDGIPEMIDRLPTIDQWYGSSERESLRMCNADTFEMVKEIAGIGRENA